MVGKKTRPARLAKMYKLMGKPYALCSDDGLDCFRLVVEHLRKQGVDVPYTFGGYSMDNYGELYTMDKKRAQGVMLAFLNKLLDKVPVSRTLAGDVLVCSNKNQPDELFLTINAGNGNMIAVTYSVGVTQLPIGVGGYMIEEAYRCRV